MLMEHAYAVENRLVEQYLLNELSPEARDAFEEHYFECAACAAELRMTDAFMKAATTELQQVRAAPKLQLVSSQKPRRNFLQWKPAFAITALAACLVVMVYQNTVTFPRLRSDVAKVETPSILPTVSLVGGNSRGGSAPSIATHGETAIVLQVDIPAQDRYSKYICSLYTPQHQLIWTVEVPAEQAKDTVAIRAPLKDAVSGTYSLEVQGESQKGVPASEPVLASYSFTLNAGTSGAGH